MMKHARFGKKVLRLGDDIRARGIEMRVAYLDGKGGVVLESMKPVDQRRFRTGTVIMTRGVNFYCAGVNGAYLSLKAKR